MLAQLATVKARLGLADATHDAILTNAILAISAWFDRECNRTLARTDGAEFEFDASETELPVPCYPVETVQRFDLKTSEADGWVEQPDTCFILRGRCVISLAKPLGTGRQQGRVIYSGGYVLPGTEPGPGQSALPADLEQAAVEQAAFWFQNRERLGLSRHWEYQGVYRDFIDRPLLDSVRAVLERHRRW